MPQFIIGIALAIFGMLMLPNTEVDEIELGWAQQVCANNGGVKAIRPGGIGSAGAACMNGARFTLSERERSAFIHL